MDWPRRINGKNWLINLSQISLKLHKQAVQNNFIAFRLRFYTLHYGHALTVVFRIGMIQFVPDTSCAVFLRSLEHSISRNHPTENRSWLWLDRSSQISNIFSCSDDFSFWDFFPFCFRIFVQKVKKWRKRRLNEQLDGLGPKKTARKPFPLILHEARKCKLSPHTKEHSSAVFPFFTTPGQRIKLDICCLSLRWSSGSYHLTSFGSRETA